MTIATTHRTLAAALLALLLMPVAAPAAPDSDARKLLAASRQRIESADYRVSGRLVKINANGNRISFPISIKEHWFPGVLRILLEVGWGSNSGAASSTSAQIPVHILLEMRPNGENLIQIAHPGDAAPVTLPFDKWSDGPLGTDFSYEDFLEAQYFWPEQRAIGETKLEGRDCDELKSTPGRSNKTHSTEVTSWLDHIIGFPVYVEKTQKGGAVKQFTYFGLRNDGGVWSAHQVEAKTRGRAGSTLLIIDRGSPHAHLGLKDFTAAQLTHF